MDEWQPIETAPKDKTSVLLIGRYPTSSRGWSDIYMCWRAQKENGFEGWLRWPHSFHPTHWMPLPANPTEDD